MLGRKNFLIIGFTGPIGAGCTTSARFFSDYNKLTQVIKGLVSDGNFSELSEQIHELYRKMMTDSNRRNRETYRHELKSCLRKREFLKILK